MYSWVDHVNSGGWMRWRKNAPGIAGLVRQGDALGRSEARRSGIHRVMHTNDLVGRWPKSVRGTQCRDVRSLCPKDVTLESMDLSDRVRMWMRTSISNPWTRDSAEDSSGPFLRSAWHWTCLLNGCPRQGWAIDAAEHAALELRR